MKKGEKANFVGILLRGELCAIVQTDAGHKLSFPINPGALIGEMAIFEEGVRRRGADVVASSDAVVAEIGSTPFSCHFLIFFQAHILCIVVLDT